MSQNTSVQYNFAHLALPLLSLGNPKRFYKDVFGRNGGRYLSEIWDGVARKRGVTGSRTHFLPEVSRLHNGMELCLISLPGPQQIEEAYYVAVTVCLEKHLFRNTAIKPHYFTLELGYDAEQKKNICHVCEWISPIPKPERINYGTIPTPSKSVFVGVIDAILSGDLQPSSPQVHTRERFVRQPLCGTVTFDENQRATIIGKEGGSPTHAMGHIFLRMLYPTQQEVIPEYEDETAKLIQIIEEWAGVENDQWTSEQEEEFVQQFEQYASEKYPSLTFTMGSKPLSSALREVFEILCPLPPNDS